MRRDSEELPPETEMIPDSLCDTINAENWLVSTTGKHGNLGVESMEVDEEIQIPDETGLMRLNPISSTLSGDQTILGIVVVVFEEDVFPSTERISREYRTFIREVQERVTEVIKAQIRAFGSGIRNIPYGIDFRGASYVIRGACHLCDE